MNTSILITVLTFVFANSSSLKDSGSNHIRSSSMKLPIQTSREDFSNVEPKEFEKSLPKSLKLLGKSADGKAVFVNTDEMTWQDGRSFCEIYNLNLFSIASQVQQDFIVQFASSGEYWTSAREHRWIDGFTWDELERVQPQFMSNWATFGESAFPYRLCASIFIADGEFNGIMVSRLCTDKLQVLCEA